MLQVVFYLQWVWHSPNIRHLFTSCRKDRLCIWFVQSENKLDKKFNSSLPLVACSRDHVLLYVICVCLHIVVYSTHCAVCFVLCVFVLCTLSWQILWIVHSWLPFRFSQTFIYNVYTLGGILIIIYIQNIIMEQNLNRSSMVDCNQNKKRGL